jgi:hypothetical protein
VAYKLPKSIFFLGRFPKKMGSCRTPDQAKNNRQLIENTLKSAIFWGVRGNIWGDSPFILTTWGA